MTKSEAIEEFKNAKESNRAFISVEALDMAIDILKKQIPKPVQYETDYTWGIENQQPVCPECDGYLSHIVFITENGKRKNKISYCEWCGQAIDWGD